MRIKLTKAAVERLAAPDPTGKQVLHLDTDVPGFGVLCSGTSTAKSYIAQKRLPNKTLRRVTIGNCAHLKLEDARMRARELLVSMAQGIDPAEVKRSQIEAQVRERTSTLRGVLANYLRTRKDLAPKTIKIYTEAVERYLAPWLDKPMAAITPDMVEVTHTELGGSAGAATANSTFRVFRALYNYAMDRDDKLVSNPVRRLKKGWYPAVVRERLVVVEELPAFYAAVHQLPNQDAADYLKLLLFTGLRRQEAAALRWDECDLNARVIRLPAARTKASRKLDLPMTTFVHKLLSARERDDGPFVFPANSKSGHIEEPKHPLGLVAAATGIAISAHDLRRTFVTVAESCDISPMALKALVNHSLGKGDVTSGYVQMTAERLRAPAQRVSDRLVELCGV